MAVAAESARPSGVNAAASVAGPRPDVSAPEIFEASAIAEAARTARLSARGTGILRKIKVREGDSVRTGQALCTLDTTDQNLRLQAATVAHMQAVAALTNARSDLQRADMMFDAGALPDQSIEKVQLAVRMAELQEQSAAVGLRMARQALTDSTLVAPFAGVITKVLAEEGQMITQMPPTTIFVLADIDTLEIKVPIPERVLSQVHVGASVIVALPALNVERRAKVDRLAEVVDTATRSAEAVVRLDNRDRALAGGLHARVRFVTIRSEAGVDVVRTDAAADPQGASRR